MPTAKQLPSGSWNCQVYNGKRADGTRDYISITAPTKEEAELLALQHKLRHREIARDSRQMTVEQAMEAYISSKSSILSPASIRTYRMYLRRHYQLIWARRLGSLTQADIQSAVNEIAATCSPKTTASMYGFLRAVLREYHPTFTPKPVLPGKRKRLQPVYTTAQIAALLDVARDTSIEIPVLLAVWLGMRRSEILGLRWDHVVLDGQQPHLVIDRASVRGEKGMVDSHTKTYSSTRVLPLSPYLVERLAAQPRSAERVVPIRWGESILEQLYKLEDQAGLPRLGLHKLRHTNASVMLMLNVADKYAMQRGGWATNYTMKYIYQHTMSDHMDAVDQTINNYFEKLVEAGIDKIDT